VTAKFCGYFWHHSVCFRCFWPWRIMLSSSGDFEPSSESSIAKSHADGVATSHRSILEFSSFRSCTGQQPPRARMVAACRLRNRQRTPIRVLIEGYSDERDSAEYNLALGERRANAARNALISAGVASGRLQIVSYGKEAQICTQETESCWQQNRRAAFSLHP
jgi:hypothetical protein